MLTMNDDSLDITFGSFDLYGFKKNPLTLGYLLALPSVNLAWEKALCTVTLIVVVKLIQTVKNLSRGCS